MKYLILILAINCTQLSLNANNDNKLFESLYFISVVNTYNSTTNINSGSTTANPNGYKSTDFRTISRNMTDYTYNFADSYCSPTYRVSTSGEMIYFINLMSKNPSQLTSYEYQMYLDYSSLVMTENTAWVSDVDGLPDGSMAWVFSLWSKSKEYVLNKETHAAIAVCHKR